MEVKLAILSLLIGAIITLSRLGEESHVDWQLVSRFWRNLSKRGALRSTTRAELGGGSGESKLGVYKMDQGAQPEFGGVPADQRPDVLTVAAPQIVYRNDFGGWAWRAVSISDS
jgi:hypothetical protein